MKFITYFCVDKKTLRLLFIRKTSVEKNEHSGEGFKIWSACDERRTPVGKRGRVILYKDKENEWIKNNFEY